MITEDYVSFEVAKLLKEKGFDEPTTKSYYTEGFENPMIFSHDLLPCIQTNEFLCPTHQMVMKWLREVHDCPIEILWHWDANSQCSEWYFVHHMELKPLPQIQYYDTYEEAAEAAIKYCLTNLI